MTVPTAKVPVLFLLFLALPPAATGLPTIPRTTASGARLHPTLDLILRFAREHPGAFTDVAHCLQWLVSGNFVPDDSYNSIAADPNDECDAVKLVKLPISFASQIMTWELQNRAKARADAGLPGRVNATSHSAAAASGVGRGSRPSAPSMLSLSHPVSEVQKDPSMMGNPTATAEFVTLVVVGVFTLGSAYWLGQVSKPYQPEFEVEKMYRKFHTFSTFWGAVGKQQSPQKERWVGTLCLVAGVFDPPFLEGGQAKKAPAPGPAEEAPLGNEDDTFSGVAAELARAAEAQEEEEAVLMSPPPLPPASIAW